MINNIVIMGRICNDIEIMQTPNGNAVTKFNVAVERNTKDRTTDFLPVVAWRNTAEFVGKYFTKGQMIAVCGEVQQRKWQDKNGNNRSTLEIIAHNVSFCGSKSESGDGSINSKGNDSGGYTGNNTNIGVSVEYEEEYDGDAVPF